MDEQQKLLQIKAEIELAKREYGKIQRDIDNLQTTKKVAFKEYKEQIQAEKDKLQALLAEGQRLQALIKVYSDAYLEIEKKVAEIKISRNHDIKQAQEDVVMIYDDAENREKAVLDREQNVEMLITNVDKREKEVSQQINMLTLQQEAITQQNNLLGKREQELLSKEEKSKILIAENQEKLDDINTQITQKRKSVQELDELIYQKNQIAEKTGTEVEARLENVQAREISVAGREDMMREKTNELIKKERWLEDREATLARSYAEVVRRSGKGVVS